MFLLALTFTGGFPPHLTVSPFGRMSYIRPSPLNLARRVHYVDLLSCTQSSSLVHWLNQKQVGFPTAHFCRSPACVGNSLGSFTIRRGISYAVLVRPPPICRRHRSWVDPKDACYCCGFPLISKQPGGEPTTVFLWVSRVNTVVTSICCVVTPALTSNC